MNQVVQSSEVASTTGFEAMFEHDPWEPIRQAEEWYAKRGFSDDDIAAMDLQPVSREDALGMLGFDPGCHCIRIPYPNDPNEVRVRCLGENPPIAKYLSAKGGGCTSPYLASKYDWDAIKSDPKISLVITEGEVKGYRGCDSGATVVGLGGVTMGATLLDGSWAWKDRLVAICFDHDAGLNAGSYKPGVHNSLGKLCSDLIDHGAKVSVLHIGKAIADPSQKCGLDDYLEAGGTWASLLKTATPAPEWCALLSEMLDESAYVIGTNHVHVYNLRNQSRKAPSDFHDTHVEKKRLTVNEAGKPVIRQISKIWMEHPARITVEQYTLNPRMPFGIVHYPDGRADINLWKGYPHFEAGSADKTFRVQDTWQKFMEGLFGEYWKWVGLWTGHALNRPWERTNQAVMLLTMVQGIGKSLFGDIVRDLCGDHGLESSVSGMFDKFNADMEAKIFVMVNELDVKFNSKEGQLNDLLSADKMEVEQKGKDKIKLPNLRRWYMTTNTSSPCRLSKEQRRVLVITPPRVMDDTRGEWGAWVNAVVAAFRRDTEALAAIRQWFNQLWLAEGEGMWDPTAPVPITEAALSVAEASMTDNQIIAQDLYEVICGMEDGWGAIHPDYKKINAKVWGEVSALVQAHGGHVSQKTIKEDGVAKSYTIYDSAGRVERVQKTANGGYIAKVESDVARERSVTLRLAYNKISVLLSDKR